MDEVVDLLARNPEARLISGGATLVAMMNARLAAPEVLVSLAGVEELHGIRTLRGGGLRIGAFTRHRETATSSLLHGPLAVLPAAASRIANATVRNMGTIGGSIAFADPGLDYPPALVAANAEIEIASKTGRRRVAASDFFVDWYTTALVEGEVVTAVELPPPGDGDGVYLKHARVSGDYATASVAISVRFENQRRSLRVAVGACGPKPLFLDEVNALLSVRDDAGAIAQAGELLQSIADPIDDVRGSAAYRLALIPRLLGAALGEALGRTGMAHV
ncbi:MAG: xanthine dehydrogenase family protein subunit M [Burkholderiales bacterium]|nr:xanthine dehydrogenase family protein subunit M [Burkholderiales bacterium]